MRFQMMDKLISYSITKPGLKVLGVSCDEKDVTEITYDGVNIMGNPIIECGNSETMMDAIDAKDKRIEELERVIVDQHRLIQVIGYSNAWYKALDREIDQVREYLGRHVNGDYPIIDKALAGDTNEQ
jgi:hypothetical protein